MDDEKILQIAAFRGFRLAYECIIDGLIAKHGSGFDKEQLKWNVDHRKTSAVPESLDLLYRGETVMAFLKVPTRPHEATWYQLGGLH